MPSVFERNPKKTLLFVILAALWMFDFTLANIFPRPDSQIRIPSKIYHHDLLPNVSTKLKWGKATYAISTDSLGFKDEATRKVPLSSKQYRILFIGDSFTEGIGYPFPKTFVGRISNQLQGNVDVLNAGVASYSPKLYFLKVRHLLEKKKLQFDEVAVFIDISDIQDEISYSGFNDKVYYGDRAEKFLLDNSLIARALNRKGIIAKIKRGLGLDAALPPEIDAKSFRQNFFAERGRWTYDDSVYKKWGSLGAQYAVENMDRLYKLLSSRHIKLTIAVYPWPEQILHHDLNSRQVAIWRKFCQERNLRFLNLFPALMPPNQSAKAEVLEHYIPGDVHWNDRGHALVAEQWIRFRCGKDSANLARCFHR